MQFHSFFSSLWYLKSNYWQYWDPIKKFEKCSVLQFSFKSLPCRTCFGLFSTLFNLAVNPLNSSFNYPHNMNLKSNNNETKNSFSNMIYWKNFTLESILKDFYSEESVSWLWIFRVVTFSFHVEYYIMRVVRQLLFKQKSLALEEQFLVS